MIVEFGARYTILILTLLHFFFNDTATTEIYTLSLHDALPISNARKRALPHRCRRRRTLRRRDRGRSARSGSSRPRRSGSPRSEEHTSELQSLAYLVCRLLLEKKKSIVSTPLLT